MLQIQQSFLRDLSLLLALLLFPTQAPADDASIRILSLLSPQEVRLTVRSNATLDLTPPDGPLVSQQLAPGDSVRLRRTGNSLTVDPVGLTATGARLRCPGGCRAEIDVPGKIRRTYHGDLQAGILNNTIYIVLYISQEELIASITESESAGLRQPAALRAFAVTARSFLSAGARHPEAGADACDTTHCQVFRGLSPSRAALAAVSETAGMTLAYRELPFRPYYSRSCGGRTATHEEVWGEPAPDYPFRSVECPCGQKVADWSRRLPLEQLALAAGLPSPELRRNGAWIEITGGDETRKYTPENFRILLGQTAGWNLLPGNRFEIRQEPGAFVFHGKGAGHGVGLCQQGAEILASRGADFRQILLTYFPGASIALH